MSHNYHPHCGCAACCVSEEAEEARQDYIDEFSPAVAKRLMADDDFAWGALADLGNDAQAAILRDVGRFFAAVENYEDSPESLAAIAVRLWREAKPYVADAAQTEAEYRMAKDWDSAEQERAA